MKHETDVGAVAREWLQGRELVVHQEVCFGDGMGADRCDLVGATSKLVVCVEAKLNLGLEVIAQARRWVGVASESWVAVPMERGRSLYVFDRLVSDARKLGGELCQTLGIGILLVNPSPGPDSYTPAWKIALRPTSAAPKSLAAWRDVLFDEQIDGLAAGSSGGGYHTKFKRTARRLVAYTLVSKNLTLGEAVDRIEHHYSNRQSAIAALSGLLNKTGKARPECLAGIRIEGRGSKATLHPVPEDQF